MVYWEQGSITRAIQSTLLPISAPYRYWEKSPKATDRKYCLGLCGAVAVSVTVVVVVVVAANTGIFWQSQYPLGAVVIARSRLIRICVFLSQSSDRVLCAGVRIMITGIDNLCITKCHSPLLLVISQQSAPLIMSSGYGRPR